MLVVLLYGLAILSNLLYTFIPENIMQILIMVWGPDVLLFFFENIHGGGGLGGTGGWHGCDRGILLARRLIFIKAGGFKISIIVFFFFDLNIAGDVVALICTPPMI